MYFIKTPTYLKTIYPCLLWDKPACNSLYLTFDDGPIPIVTEQILHLLAAYQAKATFFMIGENVRNHPTIFKEVKNQGHTIGNHTNRHLNGWKTANKMYFEDTEVCNQLIDAQFFRPPYGKIGYQQIRQLKNKYTIVMWDVLSGDFDVQLTPEACAQNVIDNALDGSIIVFHDSEKAKERVLPALEKVLIHFSALQFKFKAL